MNFRWALMLLALGCQSQTVNVAANRKHAEAWVADTLPGYTLAGFSSASLDVDGDGYISVDITVLKGESLRLIQLECPTAGQVLSLQTGEGCKFVQSPFDNRY